MHLCFRVGDSTGTTSTYLEVLGYAGNLDTLEDLAETLKGEFHVSLPLTRDSRGRIQDPDFYTDVHAFWVFWGESWRQLAGRELSDEELAKLNEMLKNRT